MGDTGLLGALVASSVLKHLVGGFSSPRPKKTKPDNAEQIGTITELNMYPIKSCERITLEKVSVTANGFKHCEHQLYDRHFMVTTETHRFVSMRRYPQMAKIGTCIEGSDLVITAPGREPLRVGLVQQGASFDCVVWGTTLHGVDCGEEAAQWVTSYIGDVPLRLAFTSPAIETRGFPALGEDKWHKVASDHHKVGFQDYSPVHLTTNESLADLNSRLAEPVDMRHFRPNIVVEGSTAFDEDDWLEVYIGNVSFRNLRPRTRCVLTTVHPDKAVKHPEGVPLEMLKTYRIQDEISSTAPLFGIDLFVESFGDISVGDPVYIVRGKRTVPKD